MLQALIMDALWKIQPPSNSDYCTTAQGAALDCHVGCKEMHDVSVPVPGLVPKSGSANIHRYWDPLTWHDTNPIVYLDCEGFGGSNEPQALDWLSRVAAVSMEPSTRNRRNLIEELIPMLTYAFSDVIVLVVDSTKTMEAKVASLIERLKAGAERVSNMKIKPCLVVVCTKTEEQKFGTLGGKPDVEDWSTYFSDLKFRKLAPLSSLEFIEDIAGLSKLLRALRVSVHQARDDVGFLVNQMQLTAHFRKAMASLERVSDGSARFDWIQATRELRPLPETLEARLIASANAFLTPSPASDNFAEIVRGELLAHLARCIYDWKRDTASDIMEDSIPKMFKEELSSLEEHVKNLEPCAYANKVGHACINLRGSHQRHQFLDKSGSPARSLKGEFKPAAPWPLPAFEVIVRRHLATVRQLYEDAGVSKAYSSLQKPRDCSQTPGYLLSRPKSNSVCLRCLIDPPHYALKCGHALCKVCQARFSIPGDSARAICPLHETDRLEATPGPVCPSPLQEGCGHRILSLSGGGVRGLSQLIILEKLSEATYWIPIACLFDLVVGTSIGGCLALALLHGEEDRVSLTISDGKSHSNGRAAFKLALNGCFESKQRVSWLQWLWTTDKAVRYWPDGLRAAMMGLLSRQGGSGAEAHFPMFSGREQFPHRRMPHIAVYASRLLDAWVSQAIPNFIMGTDKSCSVSESITLLDAAQATSAAWPYLPPHVVGGIEYFDGAFSANTPARLGQDLAQELWKSSCLDFIVSIGTGIVQAPSQEDLSRGPATYSRILVACAAALTDHTGEHGAPVGPPDRQAVFNPAWDQKLSGVDKVEDMEKIEKKTLEWCSRQEVSDQIRGTARKLLSLTWYVDPTDRVDSGGVTTLHIKSRLPRAEAVKLVQKELQECRKQSTGAPGTNAYKLFEIGSRRGLIWLDVEQIFRNFPGSQYESAYSCLLDIELKVSTPEGSEPLELFIKYGHGSEKQPISNGNPWISP
ncbi:hypothetical protein IE81DRAFT_348863 [Ceraceosorus guamensis]|uniref:FabD/lysophospholipase-like protein n=1 Tax=Ceraceosorus guamensis TaxID=1522189 RepID=A0A316VTC9_9BASI|nr:hypothetical protein IE81DRAFT_348863 [Ceraceosorus guamensis]PWN40846.1 hypothetical protein IE81DRAFT_348863 [Ceraceosorus guamensis]